MIVGHTFANLQKLMQPHLFGKFGAGLAGDEHTLYLSQVAFQIAWKTVEKLAANDYAQDCIAEEFEPFIAQEAIVDRGGMRECFGQQIAIVKFVAYYLLDLL